jgi:hypothetical protein
MRHSGAALMYRTFTASKWRRAIGLVLAYALLVQSTLALAIVTRGSVAVDPAISGAFFVICSPNGGHPDGTGDPAPGAIGGHCSFCVLSTALAAATPPSAEFSPTAPAETSAPFVFFVAQAATQTHFPRSGLTRGPPLPV